MKNKKTAYFMLPVVLAIWGVIGWKVYAAIGGKDKDVKASSVQTKLKSPTFEISDTTGLIANYRDPFLGKIIENANFPKQNPLPKIQKEKLPEIPKQELKWPKIVYHGLIRKSGSERTLGFLSVDGKSYFVQIGNDAGVVQVGKIWKDSVEIFFITDKKVFRK